MNTEHPAPSNPAVYVDPYPGRKGSERIWFECDRCLGTGTVSWGVDVSIQVGGRVVDRFCFACEGVGRYSRLVSSLRATARRHARAAQEAQRRSEEEAARLAKERAEAEARCAEYAAAHPEVVEALAALPASRFADDIRASFEAYGSLTERQAEAVLRIAREAADAPAPAPVVEGRIVIEGRVLSTKWVDNDFGGCVKMLVLDDRGFRVYGTRQGSLVVEKGDRVRFTATVKASRDDEAFGFFSRPTKAEVL